MRTRFNWAALLLVVGSTAVSLVAAEGLVRLVAPPWLRARVSQLDKGEVSAFWSDAVLPVEFQNGHFLRFTPLGHARLLHPENPADVSFDRWGTRRGNGPAWDPAKGVLVLGDSFTFGVGVADEEAWPIVWAKAVKRPVLNLGVPGSTLTDQLTILEARYHELGDPPLCVFGVFLGNDLGELVARTEHAPVAAKRNIAPILSRLNEWTYRNPVARRSYVVQLTRTAAVRLWNSAQNVPATDPAFASMRADAVDTPKARATLTAAVGRLREQSARLGYRPVVILIPDRYHVNARLRTLKAREYGFAAETLDPALPGRLVTHAMQAAGIGVADMSSCLAADAEGAYFVQDNHLTPAGHARLARCVADVLPGDLESRHGRLAGPHEN
jgi:lysophospholipase L1-like esterase